MSTPATLDAPSSPATAAPAPALSPSGVSPLPAPSKRADPVYDLFVVHAEADAAFVEAFLLPALGLSAERVKLAGGAPPEAALLGELQRAVEHSRVFLVIVTPAFLVDPWARHAEDWVVRTAIPAERTVIPLVLQRCELPLHLRVAVQLDCSDPQEWEPEAARLRQLFDLPPPLEPQLPCPYPGMRPFRTGEAAQFHGRDREITEVVARLAAGERELYVIGPSGSGKSSLIYAGVLPLVALDDDDDDAPALPALPSSPSSPPPALEDSGSFTPPPPLPPPSLLVRTFRPGDAPVTRLLHALRSPSTAAPDLSRLVADLLADAPAGASLLLFVDQLEELFALCSPAQQHLFAAAVEQLRKHPRCVFLFTLRADFLSELMQSRLWREDSAAHVNVAPLRGPALREAIERPAQLAGVHLEPALVERLLADAAFSPSILPLLQETLVQLWERRRRRLVPLSEYRAMGRGAESGLAIAIANRADRCFAELSPRAQLLAQRVLLRLVRFGEGRANTRRQQRRSDLAGGERPEELTAVLDLLTAARLIVLDAAHLHTTDDDLIDLAHEALLTAWPPLAAWIRLRRHDEEQRRIIESRAAQWIARGRTSLGLLDVGELSVAQAWRGSAAGAELGETPDMLALIAASEAEQQRQRFRRTCVTRAVICGLLLLTLVATVMALDAHHGKNTAANALEERIETLGALNDQVRLTRAQRDLLTKQETRLRQAEPEAQQQRRERLLARARGELAMRRPMRAMPYLEEIRKLSYSDISQEQRRELLVRLAATPVHRSTIWATSLRWLQLSKDGSILLTWRRASSAPQASTVEVWRVSSGSRLHQLPHPSHVVTMRFSRDEARIITIAEDDMQRTWSAHSGELLDVFPKPTKSDPNDGLKFTFEEQYLEVSSPRTGWKSARLYHESPPDLARFSSDRKYLSTVCRDSTLHIWEAATGIRVTGIFEAYGSFETNGPIRDFDLSADGRILAIEQGGRIQIWEMDLRPRHSSLLDLPPSTAPEFFGPPPTASAVCNGGLAIANLDGIVRFQQRFAGNRAFTWEHGAPVAQLACSPSGRILATLGTDHAVRLWSTIDGSILTPPLQHPSELQQLFFATVLGLSENAFVTTTSHGVYVWDLATGAQLWSTTSPHLEISRSTFDEHNVLYTTSPDGTVRKWDLFREPLKQLEEKRWPFALDDRGMIVAQ